ncbi:MAG: hypothetical protein JWQ30_1566 [Sediminibacterium sp.]|nr:hypothetical protein [Sediminibacterium sp.]
MSTWRQKAIDCCPELKRDLEQPDISIYLVFSELLPVTIEAHNENNTERLQKIYGFAEWCFGQKEKDLWNAAGVSFYEHLADDQVTRQAIPKWIKWDIYKDIRGLLALRLNEVELLKLDKEYS